jgi:hypothetical protein
MPVTVNQRAPLRPIQRPARPAMMEFINGIKTIAKNISRLLLGEYSSEGEYVLCKHETSVRFRLFPLRSLFIKTNTLSLYKKDFADINIFYFYFYGTYLYLRHAIREDTSFFIARFLFLNI